MRLQEYAALTAVGPRLQKNVRGIVALLVNNKLSISWQSKSEVQTDVSRLLPARAVPVRCPGDSAVAAREKPRRSTFTGLIANFPCHARIISPASFILASTRAASSSTLSSLVSGSTRQLQGIAPRWV